MHVVAIDWSGAKAVGGRRDIAIAECVDGRLLPIRVGLSRDEVQRWLLAKKAAARELVVGLDFAFSFPAWFAREVLNAPEVFAVWDVVAGSGETWLEDAAPWPFWGRGGQVVSTNLPSEKAFRQTERDMAEVTSTRPKSVFQLVGSGQVGPGSLRGIPMVRELRANGFAVWPFDEFALPLVVEIYPRVLTGEVIKSSRDARAEFLASFGQRVEGVEREIAATEHVFDAAISALVMSRHLDQFERLRKEDDPYALEGRIWAPTTGAGSGLATEPSVRVTRSGSPRRSLAEVDGPQSDLTPGSDVGGEKRRMVRVMRKHAAGLDAMSSDEVAERIAKLSTLLRDADKAALHSAAERQLRACRRALEPDFERTKVHHATDCWYVDRYEEGRFPGGAKRRFVLVPVETVPDGVLGCQYCESGRPAAVKLRQPIAARRPGAETNPEAATPVPAPGSAQPGTVVGAVDLVTGEMHRWSLIMPYQGRPHHGGLSSASPIGKALIGHVVGDIIEVNVPRGIRRLKLIDVSTEHA